MTSPFVITVGRQLGSGGRQIGKRLAERFGIAYYDKEILSLAAQESGLGTGVFERSDERKGFLHSIAQVVQPFFGGGGSFYDNQLSDENLFTIQSRVIQKVAAERSCVVIGRVADYILRHHPNHVNVFITASMSERVQEMMRRGARHLLQLLLPRHLGHGRNLRPVRQLFGARRRWYDRFHRPFRGGALRFGRK